MKKLKLTLWAAILVASGLAEADYQCVDFAKEITMQVKENHVTHLGDTSIFLVSSLEKTQFFGTIHSEGGVLLKKKVVEIYPFQGDKLTIVSKPKFCGRGSCNDNEKLVVSANLKVGETQTYFSCNEINP